MDFSKIIQKIGSEDYLSTSGFLYGCFLNLDRKVLENPMSYTYIAAFDGGFCAIGVKLIASFVPESFRFMIPVALFTSAIYLKLSRKPISSPSKILLTSDNLD